MIIKSKEWFFSFPSDAYAHSYFSDKPISERSLRKIVRKGMGYIKLPKGFIAHTKMFLD